MLTSLRIPKVPGLLGYFILILILILLGLLDPTGSPEMHCQKLKTPTARATGHLVASTAAALGA